MTDTIGSAEGKRRGCAFKNLSNEFVPPYACMMLVAPPDKRAKGSDAQQDINWKATGVRGFGFEVDNEYGVYIDKCDEWAMLMQDPNRFVFNTDTTVPPGGTGYCSFGEYPVRASLKPGMIPYTTNEWDSCYYAAIEDEWHVQAVDHVGAFKFFGKVQAQSLMVVLAENKSLPLTYMIGGNFTTSGTDEATMRVNETSYRDGTELFYERLFQHPGLGVDFSTPITLRMPGVYEFRYSGTASVVDPDPSDTTIPYELSVENNADLDFGYEEKASGVITRQSNGYTTYWLDQIFSGGYRVLVKNKPVQIRLKQTLSEKIATEGVWVLAYDKRASASQLGAGKLGFVQPFYWSHFVGVVA
jgi:hypothetical protein